MPKKVKSDDQDADGKKSKGKNNKQGATQNGHHSRAESSSAKADVNLTVGTAASAAAPTTPTTTPAADFDTLMHNLSNGNSQLTVKLPDSTDKSSLGFDVTRSSTGDGGLLVRKLPTAQQQQQQQQEQQAEEEALLNKDSSTYLKDGDQITSVHISLQSLTFEQTTQLLNAILPFKPELQVKTEPDWKVTLQSLGEQTRHVGVGVNAHGNNGDTPKQSSGQASDESSSLHGGNADADAES